MVSPDTDDLVAGRIVDRQQFVEGVTPDGGRDVVVGRFAVKRASLRGLEEGLAITFDPTRDECTGKTSPTNLRLER
jgi:cold shock CspA family protein